MGATPWGLVKRVYLPAVMPELITGAQLAFGNAWRALISAEMLIGFGKGLGRSLAYSGEIADMTGVMTNILVIAVLAALIDVYKRQVMHRLAVTVENLSKSYDAPVIRNFSAMVDAGEKIAIIGANGVGKTTLLRLLATDLAPDAGSVKWSENADLGYMAQDVSDQFLQTDINLLDWMGDHRQPGDDDQSIRSVLGRLLFSADDLPKAPKVLSGGEKNRMTFGRLMLGRHNVMLLDEPTNHLDMESIESLQFALEKYEGTLVFVSHDREFVSGLATRVIEILPSGEIVDYRGGYEDYLSSRGIEA